MKKYTVLNKSQLKIVQYLGLIALLAVFALEQAQAQHVVYSLQRYNDLILSPSNTGSEGKYRGYFQYRNQRTTSFSPYNQTAASGEMRLDSRSDNFFGVGAGLVIDKSSPLGYRSSNFALYGANHLKLNQNSTVHLGASAEIFSQELNINNSNRSVLEDYSYLNPGYAEDLKYDQSSEMAFGLGLSYSWNKAVAKRGWKVGWEVETGLSAQNIGRVKLKESEASRPISEELFVAYFNTHIPVGKMFAIVPSINCNFSEYGDVIIVGAEGLFVLNSGDHFNSNAPRLTLTTGILHRVDEAIVLTSFLNWGDYSVGLSYERPSRETTEILETTGAFEMILRYRFSGHKY